MAEQRMRDGRPVIWSPQPAQARFMQRTENEVLYGGAAAAERATRW